MLTLSEFASWGDIAAWAVPLFDEAVKPDAEITRTAADIAQKHTTPEARALAALRFVQDDVRYLGIELGAHSHRPHAASVVLKQRFGDCKDKSGLLVSLLRALGIEAHPVLVNTRLGSHLAGELPSPYAFNHAITRIRLDGKDVWVDPTRSAEHGALGTAAVRYGHALVASSGTTELSTIEAAFPVEPLLLTRETFHLARTEPGLDVVRTFREDEARSIRHRLSVTTRAELQKSFLNEYANMYPTIESRADMVVEDHADDDIVVLREHYAIRNFVKKRAFSVRASGVLDAVGRPRAAQRTAPLGVEYPAFYRHQIEIHDENLGSFTEPPDQNFHDASLSFTVRGDVDRDAFRLDFEVRSHRDFVPPSEVPEHVAMVDSIIDATSYSFGSPEKPIKGGQHLLTFLSSLGGLFGIVGLVVFARYVTVSFGTWRWTRTSRAARTSHAPSKPPSPKRSSGNGETAAAAIAISSRDDAEKLVLAPRCSCRARFIGPLPERAWSTAVFNEQTITVARAACPSCDEPRVRYFIID